MLISCSLLTVFSILNFVGFLNCFHIFWCCLDCSFNASKPRCLYNHMHRQPMYNESYFSTCLFGAPFPVSLFFVILEPSISGNLHWIFDILLMKETYYPYPHINTWMCFLFSSSHFQKQICFHCNTEHCLWLLSQPGLHFPNSPFPNNILPCGITDTFQDLNYYFIRKLKILLFRDPSTSWHQRF